jgi:threonine/homoserine/homoserine lactone efflux protein
MKSSAYLSLSLDALAVLIVVLPARFLRRVSTNPKVVRNLKRICGVALLVAGFLVDRFITHGR